MFNNVQADFDLNCPKNTAMIGYSTGMIGKSLMQKSNYCSTSKSRCKIRLTMTDRQVYSLRKNQSKFNFALL